MAKGKKPARAAQAAAASSHRSGQQQGFSMRSAALVGAVAVAAAAVAFIFGPALGQESALTPLVSVQAEDRAKGMSASEIAARAAGLPCRNKHDSKHCHQLASHGSCADAPGWMGVMCAASCATCDLLDPAVRCDAERIGYEVIPAFRKGSVDALFSDLAERFPEYNVTFLSRPPGLPWVAKFHNFLSDAEVQTLIDQAKGGLQRSTDQGGFSEDGVQEQVVSTGRTSDNAWCSHECEANPTVRGVMQRISEVIRVPIDNFESFQLLRYQIGQEYNRHHDMSEEDNKMLSGPRILTFFLYLSDVEEGGGTRFTDVNPTITNMPEKGSAILWPSVLNEDPTKQDAKTMHQALPVIKGTKLAANIWVHQANYKIPNVWGCTGAFTDN